MRFATIQPPASAAFRFKVFLFSVIIFYFIKRLIFLMLKEYSKFARIFQIKVPIVNNTMSLKVENLSKRYEQNWVLRDVSFEANEGEILGIFGVTGAGKSTLIRIISGAEKCN